MEFDIIISGSSANVEEWKRAMAAPRSELPPLNDEQKEMARRFRVSEEEYRRGVLVGDYGQKRLQERGKELGQLAQGIIDELGPSYRLVAVKGEMVECRWIVRIVGPERVDDIVLSRELVDDALDSRSSEEIEKIRRRILEGVAKKELSPWS